MSARVGVKGEPKTPPICKAIKRAREDAGLSQADIASAMGVMQSRVSGWEASSEPRLEVLKKLEKVLRVPRGDLLRAAGYVDDVISVGRAIEEDPLLDARAKKVLLATYRALHASAREKSLSEQRSNWSPKTGARVKAAR